MRKLFKKENMYNVSKTFNINGIIEMVYVVKYKKLNKNLFSIFNSNLIKFVYLVHPFLENHIYLSNYQIILIYLY